MSMFKQIRRISAEDIRNLCIEKGLYTGGTVDEYEAVLQLADDAENINADLLAAIADDILSRSDKDTPYNIESLMWELNQRAHVYFINIGGTPNLSACD